MTECPGATRLGPAAMRALRTCAGRRREAHTAYGRRLGGGGAMSRDTLSDLLRAVRLQGAVFYYVKGYAPWVVENPHVREIIPAIMPSAEHMIEFHALVTGSCWAGVLGESPIRMEAGDV